MYSRHLEPRLLEALGESPAVLLHGARRTGKTTLARQLAGGPHRARYLTFDDLGVVGAARTDPVGFLRGLTGNVILDEFQRCPELVLPLKAEIDRDPSPGRFLLTGSANVLLLPRLADALVGRVEILELFPLSRGELGGVRESFLSAAFGSGGPVPAGTSDVGSDPAIWNAVVQGGYPEAVARDRPHRRRSWFESYVATLLAREVRDLARVEQLTRLPDLLRLAAARSATVLNFSELSRSSQLPLSTLRRYFALLEGAFLVRRLPAWSANLGKRLVKSPKLHLLDTGLAAYLTGQDEAEAPADPRLRGRLLESFVLNEILRQTSWTLPGIRAYHYRSHSGEEVDIVLEDRAGRLCAVEVKAGATVTEHDLRSLRRLDEAVGERLVRGLLLHTGDEAVAWGPRLAALPIGALWAGAAPAVTR